MFKKPRKKMQSWTDPIKTFDPSNIGDPIARLTKWEPIESNGIFFWLNKLFKGTRELVQIESERIEFKAPSVKRICLVVMGAAMFIFIQLLILFQNGKGVIVIPLPFYLAIAVVAGCLLYLGTIPIVFDKSKGAFWRGWKASGSFGSNKELNCFARIEDIHALQLVSEYSEEKNSYIDCQLNFVLKDGSRINVADYKNQKKLKEDARTLSAFLGKPVWNGFKPFDPSNIGDPIALQTDWEPLESDGAISWITESVEIDSHRMEFNAPRETKNFYFFLIVGLGILFGFCYSFHTVVILRRELLFSTDMIQPLLVSLFFMVGGCCLLYFGTTPVVFDKHKGAFWKGRKAPDEVSDRKELKYFAKLADIHALQIVDEWCEGRTSYINYQLNLVLKDGSRLNVFENRKRNKILEAANAISGFLGKPVWDAT
jgi:hypothetical protein